MACTIADTKEHGLVFRPCFGTCFFIPSMPIVGIIGMLKEMGRFFTDQAIGVKDVGRFNFYFKLQTCVYLFFVLYIQPKMQPPVSLYSHKDADDFLV